MLLALASSLICAIASTLALSGDLAGNTGALEHLNALSMKFEAAANEQDAAALAALFTQDAVCMVTFSEASRLRARPRS